MNFITIVRHNGGVCDAAKVWQFRNSGISLRDYFDEYEATARPSPHQRVQVLQLLSKTAQGQLLVDTRALRHPKHSLRHSFLAVASTSLLDNNGRYGIEEAVTIALGVEWFQLYRHLQVPPH